VSGGGIQMELGFGLVSGGRELQAGEFWGFGVSLERFGAYHFMCK
jgi:hypothetical protein